MNYRHAEIMASEDLGGAGTKIIDLDVIDPISRITLRHEPVTGDMTPIDTPVINITKLELVDGSDVLYTLSGQEGHALNIFEKSAPPINQIQYNTGGTSIVVINIDFGRYLWDRELAFDPKRFKNPQLKLTWDEDAFDGACGAHSFMIYGHLFDEKSIAPVGFLMNKEIKAYAPTAGAYEYTDLPTDYTMRKLIVQAYRKAGGARGLVVEYKLSEDNDKRIPFDGDLNYLRSFLDVGLGEIEDSIFINAPTAGRVGYATATHLNSIAGYNNTATNAFVISSVAGNQFVIAPVTATANLQLRCKGVNPHGCVCFPFGLQNDLTDWYEVTRLGNLKLRLKGGTSALGTDTIRIITQQLRRY